MSRRAELSRGIPRASPTILAKPDSPARIGREVKREGKNNFWLNIGRDSLILSDVLPKFKRFERETGFYRRKLRLAGAMKYWIPTRLIFHVGTIVSYFPCLKIRRNILSLLASSSFYLFSPLFHLGKQLVGSAMRTLSRIIPVPRGIDFNRGLTVIKIDLDFSFRRRVTGIDASFPFSFPGIIEPERVNFTFSTGLAHSLLPLSPRFLPLRYPPIINRESLRLNRALKAGVRCPLLALLPDIRFENVELVTLLGALQGLYVVSTSTRVGKQNASNISPTIVPFDSPASSRAILFENRKRKQF